MKKQRRGISLIVLVITIIVMLILASAIVLTLSNTNIITKAKEATLKIDVQNFEQELSLTLADKKLEDSTFNMDNINEAHIDNIQEYIPSLDSKYDGKIAIKNGELVYVNYNVTEEKVALEEIGVTSGEYITSEEAADILQKANAANLETTDSTTDISKLISDVDTTQADKFVIYKGHLYYRYERTTLEERKILQQAGISCLMGDCNANGTIDQEDVNLLSDFTSYTERNYPNNLYYVGNVDYMYNTDVSDLSDLDAYLYGIQDYSADIDISKQIPEKLELLGLDGKIWWAFFDESYSTTDYKEIMKKIPSLTAKEAKKLVIKDGYTYVKRSALTEQEITWIEELELGTYIL